MHVRVLFERLRVADLKLTKHKCSFLKAHVQYLGHYISGQGLGPVPEKLEALVKMPQPEDMTGVRKFLGFVGVLPQVYPKILRCGETTNKPDKKGHSLLMDHFVPGGIRDAEGFLA